MYEKFIDQIKEVVRCAVSQAGSNYALSKKTGISQTVIGRWLKGTSSPNCSAIAPIMEFMGAKIIMPGDNVQEYCYVSRCASTTCEKNSTTLSLAAEGRYAFRKEWMSAQGMEAANAALLDVAGDSMEPLLHEGDTVLVDLNDREIQEGRLYVVTLADELRIMRIHNGLNGLILRTENPRYPDVPVEGTDLDALAVHGRVKWCGKKL